MAEWRAFRGRRWRDGDFGRLSRDARLLEIGLTSFADDDGYLDDDLRGLLASIYPRDRDMSEEILACLLQELVDYGFVRLYQAERVIIEMVRFGAEQPVRTDRKKPSGLKPLTKDIEPQVSVEVAYGYGVTTAGQPVVNQRSTNGQPMVDHDEPQGDTESGQPAVNQRSTTGQPRLDKTRLGTSNITLASDIRSSAGAEDDRSVEKPERSTAQLMNDEDIEDVRTFWVRRFPKHSLDYPMAQKVIEAAKEFGMSPPLLISRIPITAIKPIAVFHAMIDNADNPPHLEDGEHRHHSWDAWSSRPRKNGKLKNTKALAEILPGLKVRT